MDGRTFIVAPELEGVASVICANAYWNGSSNRVPGLLQDCVATAITHLMHNYAEGLNQVDFVSRMFTPDKVCLKILSRFPNFFTDCYSVA